MAPTKLAFVAIGCTFPHLSVLMGFSRISQDSKFMFHNGSSAGLAQAAGRVWTFSGREFDELRLELRVNGVPVELELKPLEVLMQLLQHSEQVVSKHELLDLVWPGLSVVEGSLSTAVYKLRKALGDDDSRIIVTVPRIGYRIDGVELRHPTHASPSSSNDWHISPGQAVPGREQWRFIRQLDASSKSEVWLAEHPNTRELRVFKFVDAAHVKALKREVTVFRFLRECLGERPDFVRIFEWKFDKPPYFLESEYGGLNLAQWAEHGNLADLSLGERVLMVAVIAETVAAAHHAGVLHKDLKPANILVTSAGDRGRRIKLADFGSASLVEPSRLKALGITSLGLTQPGVAASPSLTGTLMYLAPEVLVGKPQTALADVYALGVILYQVVIGDFGKPLAPGWEEDVEDPELREDIAAAVCGNPARRLAGPAELADRLKKVEHRRSERARLQQDAHQRRADQEKKRATRAWLPWIALACLVLISLAAGVYSLRTKAAPGATLRTVAVLPFQNASTDREMDFLSVSLSDEVATALSYARGLCIRPLSATKKYSQADVDLQALALETKAADIVRGHFLLHGDQLQLTLEAIDVKAARVLWRDTIEVPARSLIDLRDKIIATTQGPLTAALGASAYTVESTHASNEEAYELYLRVAAIASDTHTNKRAIPLLERSVGLDANFAPAWNELARRYYIEGRYGDGGNSMIERAHSAQARALALDPTYLPSNLIGWDIEGGNLSRALRNAEDLVRQHPESSDAHYIFSYALRFAGFLKEATEQCDIALKLYQHNQSSPGLRSCSITFSQLGNYRRALEYVNLDPTADFSQAILLTILLREDKVQEALQVKFPLIPNWPTFDMLPLCAQHKPYSELAAVLSKVQPLADPEANYLAAANLAYCGQNALALALLGKAVEGGYCSYPAIDSDPFFDGLRAKPEFAAIRVMATTCQRNAAAKFETAQTRAKN
jgi:DNA-binding winged helix-turn-helix (wHTH) protein/TolB-like protein